MIPTAYAGATVSIRFRPSGSGSRLSSRRRPIRLIALDSQERDDLVALYGTDADRIEVIPPGVDVAALGPAPRRARSSLGLHDGNS